MKILYIASERSRAQVATRALRTISPGVTVLWGSSYERAAFGILENPDLAALIVEVQSDSHGCSYLKQLRTLGLDAPVVMVLPEGAASPVESLKAGADYYVAKGPAFSQELPAVVSRAMGRGQESSAESAFSTSFGEREQRRAVEPSAAAGHQAKLEMLLRQERESRSGLEQKLAEATAALQEAEQRHVSATAVAAAQLAERISEHNNGMARSAATQKMLEEQLRQSRQSRASAFADVERLTLRNAELSSKIAEATATGNVLERRLAEIEAALQAANERASGHQLGIAQQAAEGQAQLQALVEQEVEKRRNLEDELARAKKAYEEAEKQRSSVVSAATALWTERQAQFDAELATAAEARNTLSREARELKAALEHSRQAVQAHAESVERLTQREAELTSQLADATAIRSTLERQLADASDKLKDANEGASRNRLTAATKAAERELELDGVIRHERATRADVEQRLAQVEAALREAEQQHASAISAATADVERLTQREAAFSSQLAEALALRSALERQLTDAANAVKDAKDGARRDLFAVETKAAERQIEFDRLIQQERAARADVEQRLAQAEAAFSSQLAEGSALRSALERQLTDAANAVKEAKEGARRDLIAGETKAAERQVEFDRLIQQERAARADVEQRLVHIAAALRETEQKHASAMTAAATERAERQTQFERELSQAAATRDDFKRRFIDAETALAAVRHDHASAASEVERLTHRESELTSQLAHIQAALSKAEQQHTSAMTAAATERADRQAQFERELLQTAATRDDFKRRFIDAETALAAVRHDHASAATEVERLTHRESELTSQLADAAATRNTLERQLTDAAAALKDAEEQYASAMTTAATERAARQAQFERELSQMAAARDEFKRRFNDTETALASARHDHASAATEVERLTHRESELTSQLAEGAATRKTLERQLTDVAAALKDAKEGAARDRAAAEAQAAEREREFDRLLGHERAVRDDAEQRLAQVEASLRAAEELHESAMTAAATERAARQAQFERELSQTAAARDEFKRRFNDTETALAAARRDHASAASEVERLTQRETELTSQLADASALRSTLEQQLAAAATALRDANDVANRDRLAAETRAAEREAEFDRLITNERARRADVEQRLAQEVAHHEALDRRVADMQLAAADAEQRFRGEIATVTARARHQLTQLESEFAREREAHKERQTRLLNDIQNLETARAALDESLTSMREHRDGLERARLAAESEVQRLAAELTEARQNLDEGRRNFQQTLDLVSSEHADAQAKFVATVADRDARIADVEKQLEESGLELRRQFLRAPLALWRCSRDGALTHANKALADLTGYRQPDELRSADFVNTVFESTDDLSWLIERCLSTKTRQSVETEWKRKNGEHLVVRLSAMEFAPDTIEIAVEDITSVRVLEERLAQAHRMEAVARLASEIAITCGRLLGDVHHDGQQWVMEVSDDTAVRKRGERLLGEVARASSYLARLAAHGDEQANALKAVDLSRVLRDLKPVLKHVAGDDVELDLSKTPSALNVDMKADRVERLLVNLASYGRERMPSGGRLKIELATVVVDQKFIADHPNVKRGHHALITVTTVRRDTPTAEATHTSATNPSANEVVSEKPGVDLGALQELLQECGGHLWLTVDPPGNMVVKIRLPLRVWDDRPQPTTSDPPTSRKRGMADPPPGHKRAMGRWFRH